MLGPQFLVTDVAFHGLGATAVVAERTEGGQSRTARKGRGEYKGPDKKEDQ
jgi:hypothetical protein